MKFVHIAVGFIQELYTEGPGYSYILPWKLNSFFTGHLTGNLLFVILSSPLKNLSFVGMLSSKTVVLDLEGYCHRKEKFIVKEIGVCTEDYNGCVLFSPPSNFTDLTNPQKISINWLS